MDCDASALCFRPGILTPKSEYREAKSQRRRPTKKKSGDRSNPLNGIMQL